MALALRASLSFSWRATTKASMPQPLMDPVISSRTSSTVARRSLTTSSLTSTSSRTSSSTAASGVCACARSCARCRVSSSSLRDTSDSCSTSRPPRALDDTASVGSSSSPTAASTAVSVSSNSSSSWTAGGAASSSLSDDAAASSSAASGAAGSSARGFFEWWCFFGDLGFFACFPGDAAAPSSSLMGANSWGAGSRGGSGDAVGDRPATSTRSWGRCWSMSSVARRCVSMIVRSWSTMTTPTPSLPLRPLSLTCDEMILPTFAVVCASAPSCRAMDVPICCAMDASSDATKFRICVDMLSEMSPEMYLMTCCAALSWCTSRWTILAASASSTSDTMPSMSASVRSAPDRWSLVKALISDATASPRRLTTMEPADAFARDRRA
mmetsp:Transcript_18386/g.63794  ORF Transcript_18386/g.63794 Transcript_18386/m.63794 type:complete len:383 (-) Transcript_18386:859-2007(-)